MTRERSASVVLALVLAATVASVLVMSQDTSETAPTPRESPPGGGRAPTLDEPADHARDISGDARQHERAELDCGVGRDPQPDGLHCCYPGQVWSEDEERCLGAPTSCPGDARPSTSAQACICEVGEALSTRSGSCEPVPLKMARVPGGEFQMGEDEDEDDLLPPRHPRHEVYVSPFEIDVYEVTVQEYERCVTLGPCTRPEKTHEDMSSFNWQAPGRERHPINGVTWYQAVTYCSWLGKRLPTEAEWEKAARGTDGRTYPWGDDPVECSRANFREREAGLSGCDQDHTSPVGRTPEGVSPYGVHDMAGNVEEWVHDWFSEDYYESSPPRDPQGPPPTAPALDPYRSVRGGSLRDAADDLSIYSRGSSSPGAACDCRGFRCARDLE